MIFRVLLLFFLFYKIANATLSDMISSVTDSVVAIRVSEKNNASLIKNSNIEIETESIGSAGSGFIITDDGYIVTSYHIIKNAKQIDITTNDKNEYKTKIIGFDKKTDIALLKINNDKKKFPYVKFGKSSDIKVGDDVIAIGNAFSLGNSVTKGIISAKNRYIGQYSNNFIQTDTPINQGNSGGPLFNMSGSVIGMNSIIMSKGIDGGNVGIGFAVPSDTILEIITKIKNNIKIIRPWIGISYFPLSEDLSKAVQLKDNPPEYGIFVHDVLYQSPASMAGIKKGDVVLSINNKKIKKNIILSSFIGEKSIGKKMSFGIWRFGENLTVDIIIGQQDEDKEVINLDNENTDNKNISKKCFVGINVENISENIKKKLNIEEKITGVVISSVINQKILGQQKIYIGNIITQINNMQITNKKSFDSAIKVVEKRGYDTILVYIYDKDNQDSYPIPVILC